MVTPLCLLPGSLDVTTVYSDKQGQEKEDINTGSRTDLWELSSVPRPGRSDRSTHV
jgi:hypothetical protein